MRKLFSRSLAVALVSSVVALTAAPAFAHGGGRSTPPRITTQGVCIPVFGPCHTAHAKAAPKAGASHARTHALAKAPKSFQRPTHPLTTGVCVPVFGPCHAK
jgi:hypothetical protein